MAVSSDSGIKLWDTTSWNELEDTAPFPAADELITWLPGPGADDLLLVYSKDRLTQPGRIDDLKVRLGLQNRPSSKSSTQMKVFVFPPWKQLAALDTQGGEIHFSPDGKSFVEDSSRDSVFPKQPRECIKVFDLPLQRPSYGQSFEHVALWPLPIACLAILIGWFCDSKRAGRQRECSPNLR